LSTAPQSGACLVDAATEAGERERDTAACLRDARLGRQSFHCQQSRAEPSPRVEMRALVGSADERREPGAGAGSKKV